MQSIRQNAEATQVPQCMDSHKSLLIKGMNEALEGMLVFMRNDMPKYDLDEFSAKKMESMPANFTEFQKKSQSAPPKNEGKT